MRWLGASVAAVLAFTSAGLPQEAAGTGPACRCHLTDGLGEHEVRDETGDDWLDKRIKSEKSFLDSIFRVRPDVVYTYTSFPRDACVLRDGDAFTVAFKKSWLIANCSEQEVHRAARVAYVFAHQYAHILQWKLQCPLPDRARELHADFMAGWYLGKRNLATLKGKPPIKADFAPIFFTRKDPNLNTKFEHGEPAKRTAALAEGFRVSRGERMSFKAAYRHGLTLFPPPHEGLAGAPAGAKVPPLLAAAMAKAKIPCTHKGACTHKVPCTHAKPCTHKVPCTHLGPCHHRIPCTHKVECRHRRPCVHRVKCEHQVPCVHTTPCVHRQHQFDLAHEFDLVHDYDVEIVPKK